MSADRLKIADNEIVLEEAVAATALLCQKKSTWFE